MRFEEHATIAANQARVWDMMIDVTRWPDWTPSVNSATIRKADRPGSLAVGTVVRIKQPRLPRADWRVTELDPPQGFTWQSGGVGIVTTASHRLEPLPDGTTRLTLILDQEGPVGRLLGRLIANMTRRYLALEAQGLKRHAEDAETPTA